MNETSDARGYEERFVRIERWIVRAVAALAALLLLSQLALQAPAVRGLITGTERWEGVRYPE